DQACRPPAGPPRPRGDSSGAVLQGTCSYAPVAFRAYTLCCSTDCTTRVQTARGHYTANKPSTVGPLDLRGETPRVKIFYRLRGVATAPKVFVRLLGQTPLAERLQEFLSVRFQLLLGGANETLRLGLGEAFLQRDLETQSGEAGLVRGLLGGGQPLGDLLRLALVRVLVLAELGFKLLSTVTQ